LHAAGACNTIVTALKTWAADPEIAEYACRAIYNFCFDVKNIAGLANHLRK
jgi:hypothetical protein